MSPPSLGQPVVAAFFKAPRPGEVKTRLAESIGIAAATQLYREMAEQQLREVPPEFVTEVHYAPRGARNEMREWLGRHLHFHAQVGGDLGRRLAHGVAQAHARWQGPVLIIGADCPSLDAATLRAAVEVLRTHDVVLGPATDGGYYLFGLRRPAPQLFAGIPWSSPQVLATTLDRVRASGMTYDLLPEYADIDDESGLLRYLAANPGAPKFMGAALGIR